MKRLRNLKTINLLTSCILSIFIVSTVLLFDIVPAKSANLDTAIFESDWSAGVGTGTNQYESADPYIVASGGNIYLNIPTVDMIQTSDDGLGSDAPNAGGFDAGVVSNTVRVGGGDAASIKLELDSAIASVEIDPADETGLLGLWHMNALNAASTISDATANNNDAIIQVGSIDTVDKKIGIGSVSLNAWDTISVSSFDNTNFPQTTGTVMFWVKGDFTGQSTSEMIFAAYDAGSNHFFIRCNNNGKGRIQIAAQGAAGMYDSVWLYEDKHYINNEWNHLVLTYDISNLIFKVYINGNLGAQGTISDNAWAPNQEMFKFGAGFTGNFDEVALYGRVLTKNEIAAHYNKGEKYYATGTFESPMIDLGDNMNFANLYFDTEVPHNLRGDYDLLLTQQMANGNVARNFLVRNIRNDARLDADPIWFSAGYMENENSLPLVLDWVNATRNHGLTTIDYDADGDMDIVSGTDDGYVALFSNIGNDKAPQFNSSRDVLRDQNNIVIDVGDDSYPEFFDYDDDGDMDLFIGSEDGRLWYSENLGNAISPIWNTPAQLVPNFFGANTGVSLAALNNDGLWDVLCCNASAMQFISNINDGSPVNPVTWENGYGQNSSPGIRAKFVDFNGDNLEDIIYGQSTGINAQTRYLDLYTRNNVGDGANYSFAPAVKQSHYTLDTSGNITPNYAFVSYPNYAPDIAAVDIDKDAIILQLAVSNSSNGPWTFLGPDGTSNTYFSSSGMEISQDLKTKLHGKRYLKYKAYFFASDQTFTPVLKEVKLSYTLASNCIQTLYSKAIDSTDPDIAWTKIGWNSNNSAARTTVQFRLRTGNGPDTSIWPAASWGGPSGTGYNYYQTTSAGETTFGDLRDGLQDRYMQYEVVLGTTNPNYSPVLSEVRLYQGKPQIILNGEATIKNGGGAYVYGVQTPTITWDVKGMVNGQTVDLYYDKDNAVVYPDLIAPSVDAIAGSYAWTLPAIESSTVKVKLINQTDYPTDIEAESAANFSIRYIEQFDVSAETSETAGEVFPSTITPKDVNYNEVTGVVIDIFATSTSSDLGFLTNAGSADGNPSRTYTIDGTGPLTIYAMNETAENVTITISASDGSGRTGTRILEIVPADPDHVAFEEQPASSAMAGEVLDKGGQVVTLKIVDAYDNTCYNEDGINLSISKYGSASGTLYGTKTVPTQSGEAMFPGLYFQRSGTFQLQGRAPATYYGGITPTDQSNDIIISSSTAEKIVLIAADNDIPAGTSAPFTVERRDQFDNLVPVSSMDITLSAEPPGTNSAFSASEGGADNRTITIPGGDSSVDFWYYEEEQAEYTITARSGIFEDSAKLQVQSGVPTGSGVYSVKTSFVYNETTDKMIIRAWLDNSGAMIRSDALNKLGLGWIEIFDDETGKWVEFIDENTGDITTKIYLTTPVDSSTGLYLKELTDITQETGGLQLTAGKSYYVQSTIEYGGDAGNAVSYASGDTFTVSVSQTLKEITESMGTVTSEIAAQTSLITNAVKDEIEGKMREKVDELKEETAKILASTNELLPGELAKMQETVDDLYQEVGAKKSSRIITRATQVKLGNTVRISFETMPNVTPVINVYDPAGTARISNGVMRASQASKIYDYDVTFLSDWGSGDYNIVCREPATAASDSITMSAYTYDIDDIAQKVSQISTQTEEIGGNSLNDTEEVETSVSAEGLPDVLNAKFGVLEAALSKLSNEIGLSAAGKSLAGGGRLVAGPGGGDTEGEEGVEEEDENAENMSAVFEQLTTLSAEIKELGADKGINLEKLYNVSKDKKDDMTYLKNKAEELKATAELSRKIIETTANKPVVQEYFAFR